MSRVCQLTGKRPKSGHNVSHSNRKTKRRFLPNLVTKTFLDPRTGKKFKAKVATSALRTMAKNPRKLLELARIIVG
jgi:large subunit ribosomal protein L28